MVLALHSDVEQWSSLSLFQLFFIMATEDFKYHTRKALT